MDATSSPHPASDRVLLASSGDEMLRQAITLTLQAAPPERADLFERLTREIIAITTASGSGMRPWTCTVHAGTDGSRIFRGGIGFSIAIDPGGRLWRGGTYEDFATNYAITPSSCEIVSMQPRYAQMREYVAGPPPAAPRSPALI